MVRCQTNQRQEHHADFEYLHADRHRTLAITIRQKPARHGKHDERQGEQSAHNPHELIALVAGHLHPDNDVSHQPLQSVVTECPLKLCDKETPKPPQRRSRLRCIRIIHLAFNLWPKASNGAGKGLIEKNSPAIDLMMSPQPADFWTPAVVKLGKAHAPSSTLMPDKAVAQPVLPNHRASVGIWRA